MKKVLVIGDGCKDVFQYGRCDRICPEAPVPVFKPVKSVESGGMAINVYNNLLALGIDCDILTYSGISKTRYIDEVSNQMLLRIDENDQIFLSPNMFDKIVNFKYEEYDAIVISDYDKGFLSKEIIKRISEFHHLVFMDSKKKIGEWARNIDFIKINKKEFDQNRHYLTMEHINEVIVTTGKEGALRYYVENNERKSEHYSNNDEHPVRDLSGAGDTFLAGLVADYIKNNDICRAIEFANRCAAWVVSQKGVAVVNPDKI